MRTTALIAVLVMVSAATKGVNAQTSLPGPAPRPLELIPADGSESAAPAPPVPGAFVPPGSTPSAPTNSQLVPTYSQPLPSYGLQSSPASTITALQPEISPNNPDRWRYVNRNGEWWYYTPTRQWMYWSGGRWVQYARPAVSNTSVYVQPPVVSRPRVSVGVGVGPAYYPYGGYYPYGPYPYGPYPYGYGGYGRVGIGVGVGVF